MSIHGVEPGAANEVDTAFVSCLCHGMLCGTKVGDDVYEMYGGWLASGGLNIGTMVSSYVVILTCGPHGKLGCGNQVGVEKRDQLAAKPSRAHCIEAEPIKKNENGANTSKGVVVYEAGA